MYPKEDHKFSIRISFLIALLFKNIFRISSYDLLSLRDNVHQFSYDEGDFGCELGKNTERLQIAFVVDTTGTNYKNIQNAFAKACRDIINGINAIHEHTEFAITTHSNWEDNNPRNTELEDCYTRQISFTTDVEELIEVASNLGEIIGSGEVKEGNSIPAVCLTVADTNIGWVREDVDGQGKRVHKIVVLFTEVYSVFELFNPGNQTEFRGDGTDTCQNNLPPIREFAGKFLKENGIIMIGMYVGMNLVDVRSYVDFFNEFEIPHIPTTFKNAFELKWNIAKVLAQTVKDHLHCYFEDPPAYNTLGL